MKKNLRQLSIFYQFKLFVLLKVLRILSQNYLHKKKPRLKYKYKNNNRFSIKAILAKIM